MTIEITNLAELDPAAVSQTLAELRQMVQERNPSIDVKRGVFHDLLLLLHAELSTQHQTNLSRYLDARSLKQIEADPTLADDAIVDDVLSNYRVTRRTGSAASGDITIVVSTSTSVTIAAGAVFTANGSEFTANNVYTAKSETAQVLSATDRLLVPMADGNYAFNITVTASELGAAGRLTRDTLIVPETMPANYVTSYVASDFSGGASTETNTAMISRLQQGLAAKATSNRVNMQGMLAELFPAVMASSIVGHGDAEMLRDQHSILPVSLGGCVDWYVRSQEQLLTYALTMTATLVEKNVDGSGEWQLEFNKNTAPGFYEISSIRPLLADNVTGSFAVTADVRSNDMTGTGHMPDIQTTAEGAYSRFQTAVIRFVDTVTDHSEFVAGDTVQYAVAVRMLPSIAEIHDAVASREYRGFGSDVLVKAPVPCFVTLSLTIFRAVTGQDPDLDAIKQKLADVINAVGFTGRVYASQLQDAIHEFLQDASVGAIDMLGRMRYPDGTIRYIRSSSVLQAPDAAASMVSYRTVQFFINPEDIAISVSVEVPNE